MNVSAGRNEFDNGSVQNRYSIGGFIPLTEHGLNTGKWQLFAPFGYSYSEGETAVTDANLHQTLNVQVTNSSAYVGLFGIRPFTEKITLLSGGIYTRGADAFSGISLGLGLSYHLTEKDSVAVMADYIDNDFGQEQKVGVSYRHEF